MSDSDPIAIEVAYATPAKQRIVALQVPAGTTARAAALRSGLTEHFAELNLAEVKLGVFGKAVADDQPLQAGDRVELYRPLLADPKAARRTRADRAAGR